MNVEEFYRRIASVVRPVRYYRSSKMMHVSIPQDLDSPLAREILLKARIDPSYLAELVREQQGFPDTKRRVGVNNLERMYDIFDRPIAES